MRPFRSRRACIGAECDMGTCKAGQARECYTGREETIGVGPCVTGMQTCTAAGQWGNCIGQVIPVGETCGDGVDNNCNGTVDEDRRSRRRRLHDVRRRLLRLDRVQQRPALVNPAAFDAPGNNVDDDCDGMVDNTIALCDQGLTSDSTNGDGLREGDRHLPDGDDGRQEVGRDQRALTLARRHRRARCRTSHAIRPQFGTKVDAARRRQHGAALERRAPPARATRIPAYHDFVSYYERRNDVGLPGGLLRGERRQAAERAGLPRSERHDRERSR